MLYDQWTRKKLGNLCGDHGGGGCGRHILGLHHDGCGGHNLWCNLLNNHNLLWFFPGTATDAGEDALGQTNHNHDEHQPGKGAVVSNKMFTQLRRGIDSFFALGVHGPVAVSLS